MPIIDCPKCGKRKRNRKDDRYCIPCRQAYNRARAVITPKASRSDAYYWNVTVPKLRARLNKKYPMEGGKIGVYHPMLMVGPDNEGFQGLAFNRTGHNPEDA